MCFWVAGVRQGVSVIQEDANRFSFFPVSVFFHAAFPEMGFCRDTRPSVDIDPHLVNCASKSLASMSLVSCESAIWSPVISC